MTHFISTRWESAYAHLRAVTRQVARDIIPRLLLVTGGMVLIFDNQDLDGLGPRKQWQSVHLVGNVSFLFCR